MKRLLSLYILLSLSLANIIAPAATTNTTLSTATSTSGSENTEPLDTIGEPTALSEEGENGVSFLTGVIPPSPQAAALARYAEYPVGHTTGVPEISIPIYEICLGSFTLPVSLDYHSAGSRPGDYPTQVGLGWSLNAGGAVTRSILGKPDLFNNTQNNWDTTYYDIGRVRQLAYDAFNHGTRMTEMTAIVGDRTECDTESDRYSFNVAGRTGIFRYSFRDGRFVILNNSNDSVYALGRYGLGGYGDYRDASFHLLSTDGVRYNFGCPEQTGVVDGFVERPFTTAWYLTSVETPEGTITLKYTHAPPLAVRGFSSTATAGVRPVAKSQPGANGEEETFYESEFQIKADPSESMTHYGQELLTEIEWRGNRVLFSYVNDNEGNPRGEVRALHRLTEIKVVSAEGDTVKRVTLDNTDFWPTGDPFSGRRLLRSVSDSQRGTWSLDYYRDHPLPPLPLGRDAACYSDLWGFLNKATPVENTSVFTGDQLKWMRGEHNHPDGRPCSGCPVVTVDTTSRVPNLVHARSGVLRSVTWPTGGTLELGYGLNSFGGKDYGGLRVESMTLRESPDGGVERRVTYDYAGVPAVEEPDPLCRYISYERIHLGGNDLTDWPVEFRAVSSFPTNPVTASNPSVAYHTVTETYLDGSSSTFVYDQNELSELFGIQEERHPSLSDQSILDFGQRTPLLTGRYDRDPSGKLVSSEESVYSTTVLGEFVTGVRTASPYAEYDLSERESARTSRFVAMTGPFQYVESRAKVRASLLMSRTVTDHKTDVAVTTGYGYDPLLRTYQRKSETVTNSDGVAHRTEYVYPFERQDAAGRGMTRDLVTDIPVGTVRYADGRPVAATATDYSYSDGFWRPLVFRSWSARSADDGLPRMPATLPEVERVSGYNAAGRPLSVTVNGTDVTTFTWSDSGDLLLSTTDPGGLTTGYTHRPLVGLASVTLPDGRRASFSYNGAGMLSAISDSRGARERFSYSLRNHPDPAMSGAGNSVTSLRVLDESGAATLSRQYHDGLGRPSVLAAGGLNTSGEYVYTATGYDSRGRESLSVLPSVGGTSPEELSADDVRSLASATYGDAHAYSVTTYDGAGRPVHVSTPGEAWDRVRDTDGRGLGKTTVYVTNGVDDVRLYRAPMSSLTLTEEGFYPAGTLGGVRSVDEDGRETTVFSDRLGRKVLERRGPVDGARNAEGQAGNDTYFVYNDLGQLRYVLSPEYEVSGFRDRFAYEYRYDDRGRVSKKILPGAGLTQYWYDDAGRMYLSEDVNLRKRGRQRFYLYDRSGRPVAQGVGTNIQHNPEVNTATFVGVGGTGDFNSTGYRIPNAHRILGVTLESVTYYDGYSFLGGYDGRLGASDSHRGNVRGLRTGSVTYASDGSRRVEAIYYDDRGNVRETRVVTEAGRLRVTHTYYDYLDNPWWSETEEDGVPLLAEMDYDPSSGLPTRTCLTVNSRGGQFVSDISYDALGRVASNAAADGSLTTSFNYNLHGRVTGIDGPAFSQTIHYADGPGNRLYNGSVSSMSWTMGDDPTTRGFSYSYNGYGWLTEAVYGEGPGLSSNRDRYTETFGEFRPNGQPRRIRRSGLKDNGEYGKIDNLHVRYEGNRVVSILEDALAVTTPGAMDFAGETGEESHLIYNSWGALVYDESRGIDNVVYDCLGHPVRIEFRDGGTITHVYSASGERIRTETETPVYSAFALPPGWGDDDDEPVSEFAIETLEYSGPYIYRNGTLSKIIFDGGYVTMTGGNPQFHYYTQDYLGNNRAVVNGNTGEVEQTIAYYPFGGVIADLGFGHDRQQRKFGGKELTTANGLNEYDFLARQYWPIVPMFTTIDPECEHFPWLSPYLYCGNDPVNAVDKDGKFLETLWDIGNVVYDVAAAAVNHAKGDHAKAVEHWVDAGVDALAMAIPGLPAGATKIAKAAKAAETSSKATKVGKGMKNADKVKEGVQYEEKVVKDMIENGDDIATQVRLVPLNGKGNVKGNRTNADILRREKDGSFTLIEVKLSSKSKLRPGQKEAKLHIDNGPKDFEIRTNVESIGLEKGEKIVINQHIVKYKYD